MKYTLLAVLFFAIGGLSTYAVIKPANEKVVVNKISEIASLQKKIRALELEITTKSRSITKTFDPKTGNIIKQHQRYLVETEKKSRSIPSRKMNRSLKSKISKSKREAKKVGSSTPSVVSPGTVKPYGGWAALFSSALFTSARRRKLNRISKTTVYS